MICWLSVDLNVNPDSATDTPYPDNILFADKNNSDNKIIVPVNVTIPAPAVSNVTRDPKDGPDFGTLVD